MFAKAETLPPRALQVQNRRYSRLETCVTPTTRSLSLSLIRHPVKIEGMKCTLLQVSFWLSLSLHLLALDSTQLLAAEPDVCAVCGGPFGDVYYSIEDKVTLEKKHVCKTCDQTFPDCFICGLPANTNLAGFIELPDKRALCARDAKTAVLQEEDGLRICREVRDQLDRLFSRFTNF